MKALIKKFDVRVFGYFRRIEVPLARLALFIVYFWFGALKAWGMSPATPLVRELAAVTIPFISFPSFYGAFAFFEMAIGLMFLMRGAERLAILLAGLHLGMTALPLIFLPYTAWQGFLVPTLEGQYIIKNILIVALAVTIGSHTRPLGHSDRTAESL